MPLSEGLDAKDIAIIEALQADGRISLSELGRRIGLSQPSMSERVRRLEERGIITGYSARIDPLALGLALSAIIRLKTTHEHMRACLETFERLPYVVEVHRVTGDDCFVLKALVPAAGDLATIVDAIGRFGPVTTSVVLQSQPPRPIGRALLQR
ncbi:Lrp/AsnC family transcriptional regulator [Caulobacter sp. BE254]|uniref:Lrp/AsnC family transcriptional regulator n=1 Tax=Caulobacter sp. BE254 TaxID=2817720 RepID=UPI002854897B|nr:Lrp/AsnC family transcriptional regulator [Caulobacter sp. BE254]MDR7118377.1 Lrp/AsnC family leucine-responsive transcriptional regulator [Caulobacter sp. BE254]